MYIAGIDRTGATWLLDQCNVNWDKQAIRYAQNYIKEGLSHTKKELICDLIYAEFTESQAQKAADICWKD